MSICLSVVAHFQLKLDIISWLSPLTLYRMVMPIGTPFLKEKN